MLRKLLFVSIISMFLAISLFASSSAAVMNAEPDTKPDPDVVKGNNEFALNLYKSLDRESGNLFLSPYSISSAAAMVFAGARGETRDQMASVLHFPSDTSRVHTTFGLLDKELSSAPGKSYQLRVANALWGQKGFDFLPSFKSTLKNDHGAEANELDFVHASEAARSTINDWVAKKTEDRIQNLLGAGSITPATRLVLTNAIYFKGDWQSQFKKENTANAPFTSAGAAKFDVPMMHQTGTFGYASTEDYQVLELSYAGNDLSMLVILPRKLDGLTSFENELTPSLISSPQIHSQKVEVMLPKFHIEKGFELNGVLAGLGMQEVFNDSGDLSGMDGRHDLKLSLIVHKAFIDVDEKGTEAAAATGAVATMVSAMPQPIPVFRADHPFMFAIRDKRSGSILFLGRYSNPA